MITGKDLIELGYEPGKWFAKAIEDINRTGIVGESMIAYLELSKPQPVIPLHDHPLFYYENIRAENEIEVENINKVRETMNLLMKTPTLIKGAIMPDACPAGPVGTIPVGGVVVAKNAIHPGFHSADICCSLMLTNFMSVSPIVVLNAAQSITHFGGGGRLPDRRFELPEELIEEFKGNYFLNSERSLQVAKEHLGTQGDGNHFLFVGVSENTGATVLITHHGSRGVGAMLYKKGMAVAEKYRKELSPDTLSENAWIPSDSKDGEEYWKALQIVRKWTKINHSYLHDAIGVAIGMPHRERFWNEHNFVFKDEDLFYHAKGATPLLSKFMPDAQTQARIIPLNMSEPVLIVKGEATENNLGFAPHGAGRNTSRNKHKLGKVGRTDLEIFADETRNIDARFFSGQIDISELPSAYKNAEQVVDQMKEFNLGVVVDRIMPFGCIMAGDWQVGMNWKIKKQNRKTIEKEQL